MNICIEQIVTIIIPSRTYDFLLEKCIKEIRTLYKNVPIIIILDDNSNITDSELNNIKIIKSEQTNISEKRNIGVNACKTKHIAFIDSDAYPNENWLENGINFLENNLDYSVVTGSWLTPPEETLTQKCIRLVKFSPLFVDNNLIKLIDNDVKDSDEKIFASANIIMRKKDYIEVGGMNKYIYLDEDSEFSNNLYKKGYKIRFKNNVSIYHRTCSFLPFLRKVYCYGYYKTNMSIQEKRHPEIGDYFTKNVYKYLIYHISILLYFILILTTKNLYVMMIPPIIVLTLLIIQSIYSVKKLDGRKILGFFIILYISVLFCIVFMFASLLGMLNIPVKNIHNIFKHY